MLEELARSPEEEPGPAWGTALHPGAIIGRFQLVRQIGRGGFGVVWEAQDRELRRSVAFKLVRPGRLAIAEDQLGREAEVIAQLSHPNLVTLFDVGRCEHGPYLILELLRGETLEERLRSGPVAPREAVRLAAEMAAGLAHAHARGVVHRDLKPSNVFLCQGGGVKLLDFGMSHFFGRRRVGGGTPAFMAPEQWRGAPEDERTDVYALGLILFRMLAGELPFPEGGRGAPGAGPAPQLEVPEAPGLGELVARMTEEDPVDRPRDGGEVLAALAPHRQDLERSAPSTGSSAARALRRPPRPGPAPSGRPWRRGAIVAGAAAALAAGALAVSPALRQALADLIRPARLPAERKLAVLPFHVSGGSPGDEAFSAGLGEVLTGRLAQLEGRRGSLLVVSASDVLKEGVRSAREARTSFGATLALAGSVLREGDRVAVSASLVDTRTLVVLDARDVEARLGDASGLQRQLVERVAEMLHLRAEPAAGPARSGEPAPGAYEFYLQGRGYLQRYDRSENLESALAVLDQALARDPAYALAHAGRAEAFLRRHELNREARFLEEARRSGRRALDLDERLAAVQITMGLVHAAAGERSEAIARFRRALELEPASADAHRELANACDAAGRPDEAEATFRRAIELRPDSWAAYKDLGVFYNRHGRLAEALPLFQRVVELTPDNYAGYANLGGIQLKLGHPAEAAQALERSLALRPTDHGYANLGTVYYHQQRYRDAARLYRKAVELNPTDSRYWGNLGDADRWSGLAAEAARDYRQAIALLEKQLEASPRDPEAWGRLAMHESALGEREKALSHAARALRLDPADGQVLFRSALIYEEAGLRDRALAAVQSALEAGHSRQEIDKAPPLERLRKDPRYRELVERIAGGSNPK